MIIGWKAWFVNVPEHTYLLRFDSRDTPFIALPKEGCLGFVLFEDTRKSDGKRHRVFRTSADYYFQPEGWDEVLVTNDKRERNAPEEIKKEFINPYIIYGVWTKDEFMETVNQEMRLAECP